MRSRQSLHEPPSQMHSPSEEEEPGSDQINGYEEELRGRVGKGVSSQ
jgi:choline-phosphate cytidylyltransferase